VTVRPLPRSRLDALVPSLVAGQALVALVPVTGDLKWAAGAAWDVARAAALTDRRIALVDLWLEQPTLHETVGLTPAEGIVDAFEYDVSLTKAAHQVDRVFFIAAGAVTAHAGDLFANPRWKKLHGGFRVEDALLLLYLSAGALARLSAVPDGLIVLSPDGYEPESSVGQGITAVMERGVPLLGVVRDRWTPATTHEPDPRSIAPPPGRISALARRPSHRRTRPVAVAAMLAAGAAGGWVLFARGAEQRSPRPPHPAHVPAPAAAAPVRARPVAAAPAPRVDSLAWTIQLAAYARLDKALALADRLAGKGVTPFVTPVALDGRGGGGSGGGGAGAREGGSTVWYRVLAGAFPTRDSAVGARAGLWERGLATRGQGDVLRAPYSFALSERAPSARTLRARGIPAVPWGTARATGSPRLLTGAFESPEQAALLEARLKKAGVQATLVTRIGGGTTP
jgi:sporulation related protein